MHKRHLNIYLFSSGTMKKLVTKDNSVTFHNEKYNEAYHSITVGAIDEAIVKYVEPAGIENGNKVLDFCFGLGYNSLAAIMAFDRIEIVGIENDMEIIKEIKDVEVPEKYAERYKIIRNAAANLSFDDGSIKIRIAIEDARTAVKKLTEKFDAVLFDPFSPKVCPELWTEEVFKDVFKVMQPGGRLTTYSCARVVRENLKKAGFEVVDGPCFGRRSPATVGIKPSCDTI